MKRASTSPASEPRPRLPRWLLAVPIALALAGLLAPAPHSLPAGTLARQPPAQTVLAPSPQLAQWDELREDATIGDLEAAGLLVTHLLDRYERAGDANDLFEAVQWMDREWRAGYYQRSGLATRVFERHCAHKVLRWHWICDAGE